MDDLLVVGSLFGAAIGVAHGAYVFAERISRRDSGLWVALYYAVWTVALWAAFGTYVLVLFLIAVPLFAIRGATRWIRGWRRLQPWST